MSVLPDIQRHVFLSALEDAVGVARSEQTHLGLLLIDLSNLAHINHSFGYAAGDDSINNTLELLLGISKIPGTVFRVSGHHFAFILPGLDNPAFVVLAMNRVIGLLTAGEVSAGVFPLKPDIKIGGTLSMYGERDALSMLECAEVSLREAKQGKEFSLENAIELEQTSTSTQTLEQQFLEALRDNSFDLHYQPKVNLVTGAVLGAEALLRWTTPTGDRVNPEQVVMMAGQFGRAFELTKCLAHRCMRDLASWRDRSDIGVALNVQAGLVNNLELGELLRDAAAIWGLEPQRLTVEITEEAFIEDIQAGSNNLQSLKDSGFRLSIDDFGTGYSSLSYFKHIPASELKIDRSFVSNIRHDEQDRMLVETMIKIARQFGLSTVGEGIEDEDCMRDLAALGCDYGQGYFFSPPLPFSEFQAWLLDWEDDGAAGLLTPQQRLWPRVSATCSS